MGAREVVRGGLANRLQALMMQFAGAGTLDKTGRCHGEGSGRFVEKSGCGAGAGAGGGHSLEDIKGYIQGRIASRQGSDAEGTKYETAGSFPAGVEARGLVRENWVDGGRVTDREKQGLASANYDLVVREKDGAVMLPRKAKGRDIGGSAGVNHVTFQTYQGMLSELIGAAGGLEKIVAQKPLWAERRPTAADVDGVNYIFEIPGTKRVVLNVAVGRDSRSGKQYIATVMPEPPDKGGVGRRAMWGTMAEAMADAGVTQEVRIERLRSVGGSGSGRRGRR